MSATYEAGLRRNLSILYLFRTFNKRAYLPLISIYAVSVADLTLSQFGLIAGISSAVSLILEIPSGYISDIMGHKRSLILGQALMMLSPLGYVLFPNFAGVLIGSAGYFGGYAFISGTQEALIHEGLIELGREKDYMRIAGRTQSVSLLANVILISTIPLTYTVDPRLPFLVGAFLLGINFVASFFLTSPKQAESAAEHDALSFTRLIRTLYTSKHFPLFMLLGVTMAASNNIPQFKELYLLEYGVPVSWMGFIAAATGLLAALGSYNLHNAEKLSERTYFGVTTFSLAILTILAGFIPNPWLAIGFVAFLVMYTRNDGQIARAYILRDCPTRQLKATYISLLSFIDAMNGLWIPVALGYLATQLGVRLGYTYFGIILLVLTSALYGFYLVRARSLDNKGVAS